MHTIGIVGRGFMARTHAVRYGRLSNVQVVGVTARGRPTDFVDRYTDGATAYTDATAMVDGAEPDVVDICTPTDTHRELVEIAANAGAAILCEKPLERTLEDSLAIVDTVESAGVPFMPGHVVRFFPAFATAKSRIEDHTIGTVGNARAFRASPSASGESWYQDRDRSGGALYDLAVHDFDFLRWVCGDVERVFSRRRIVDDGEYALTTLRFADGTVGHVDTRWTAQTDDSLVARFEFSGTDGHMEFDSAESTPIEVRNTANAGESPHDPIDIPLATDPYARQLRHFLDSIERGDEPRVTLTDALEATRIGLAAVQSAERGESVALDAFR